MIAAQYVPLKVARISILRSAVFHVIKDNAFHAFVLKIKALILIKYGNVILVEKYKQISSIYSLHKMNNKHHIRI